MKEPPSAAVERWQKVTKAVTWHMKKTHQKHLRRED
jgi:hypothetical protein